MRQCSFGSRCLERGRSNGINLFAVESLNYFDLQLSHSVRLGLRIVRVSRINVAILPEWYVSVMRKKRSKVFLVHDIGFVLWSGVDFA
jgi:hypothetical protein